MSFILVHIVLRFAVGELGFEVVDLAFLLAFQLAQLSQKPDGRLVAGMGFEVLLVDVDVGVDLV